MNYRPGKCNIGAEEVSRRFRIGYFGIGLTILTVLLISIGELPRLARLIVILPAGMALVGFIQATNRFCLFYGLRGLYSIEGRRQWTRISDPEALIADKTKSLRILAIVVLGSILITAIYYILP